jgi:hypothetical protein
LEGPITQALDAKYGGGYVVRYTASGRLEHVGIENLRADCAAGVDANQNTPGALLTLDGVFNSWVSRVTNDKMSGHTVKVEGSKWLTIQDVVSFHNPLPGPHHGASTQIFTFTGSQYLLFQRITASDGGFEFSSGGLSPGPNVYLDSKVPHGFAATAPHMKWAVATLYDSLDLHQALAIQNNDGSHGWTGANQVVWNVSASKMDCDRPPTVHQWAFGVVAQKQTPTPRTKLGALPCEFTSWGKHVQPQSLYRAQLAERLGPGAVTAIGPQP